MPELAEVETLRRDVDGIYVGRRFTRVEVGGLRSVRRHPDPARFVERVEGRRLIATGRRGKYLVMFLDSGDAVVAHMGMSGQLLRAERDGEPVPHAHIRFRFDRGPELHFVDPRTFGQVWVTRPEGGEVPELAALGFDPLEDPGAEMRWQDLLTRPTKLKPLLMDQSRIAGIGNMYADEILHEAGLRPDRPAASLSAAEGTRLSDSARTVLTEAIRYRGSSLADEQYRDLFGRIGSYQEHHKVYAKAGEPCSRCGEEIARVRSAGRSWYFCPGCQR